MYYLGQVVTIPIKITSTVDRCVMMTLTSPSGQIITDIFGTKWASVDPQTGVVNSIIDNSIYTVSFTPTETGVYIYKIEVFNNCTDLVPDTAALCNCGDSYGTFNILNNPLNECISNFAQNECSLANHIAKISSYMYLYENLGDGSCPYTIKASTSPLMVQIMRISDGSYVAGGHINKGKGLTFMVDPDLYKITARNTLNCRSITTQDVLIDCNQGNICASY